MSGDGDGPRSMPPPPSSLLPWSSRRASPGSVAAADGGGGSSGGRMLEEVTTARVVAFVEQWLDEPGVEALVVLHRGFELAVLDTVMLDTVAPDDRPTSPEVVSRFGASIGRHVLTRSQQEPATYALLAQGPAQRVLAQEQLIVERAISPLAGELRSTRQQQRVAEGDGALLLQASSSGSGRWGMGLMAPHPRPMPVAGGMGGAASDGGGGGWGLGGDGGHAAVAVPFLESATSQGVLRQGMRHHEKMAQLYHRSVGAVMSSALKREDMLLEQVDRLRARTTELDRELDDARHARVEEHARRKMEAVEQRHARAMAELEESQEKLLEHARKERDLDRTAVIRNILNQARTALAFVNMPGGPDGAVMQAVRSLSMDDIVAVAEALPTDKAQLFIKIIEGARASMVGSEDDQLEEACLRRKLKEQEGEGSNAQQIIAQTAAAIAEGVSRGPWHEAAKVVAEDVFNLPLNLAEPTPSEAEAAAGDEPGGEAVAGAPPPQQSPPGGLPPAPAAAWPAQAGYPHRPVAHVHRPVAGGAPHGGGVAGAAAGAIPHAWPHRAPGLWHGHGWPLPPHAQEGPAEGPAPWGGVTYQPPLQPSPLAERSPPPQPVVAAAPCTVPMVPMPPSAPAQLDVADDALPEQEEPPMTPAPLTQRSPVLPSLLAAAEEASARDVAAPAAAAEMPCGGGSGADDGQCKGRPS